jgi:hypothetical protein
VLDVMQGVPFDSESWTWSADRTLGLVDGVELGDGTIELELAVERERSFHGVVWRVHDDENFESFFVRPHQVGNPDAIQYTPVFNGVSSWQLYHGPGYWAPIAFPIGERFSIRVAFDGRRAEVFVGDAGEPALAIRELKRAPAPGRVGVLAGGPGLHLHRFAYDPEVGFRAPLPPPVTPVEGIVPAWWVSDPFPEEDPPPLQSRSWTRLESEPTGLADLARVNGIRDGKNTVYARTTIRSSRAQTKELALGFSDRAVVSLNARPLYRGSDTYRSRDYRFLGSIGWYDTLYLPLERGENELVVTVSEDFGGWGVQARFTDLADVVIQS